MSEGLWAISALDGRYHEQLGDLGRLTSEGALIRYRIRVEAHWLLCLSEQPQIKSSLSLTDTVQRALTSLSMGDIPDHAPDGVKALERTTNHDVKAVEYWLQNYLGNLGASNQILSFIHFACTSEDINNLSYGMMLAETRLQILLPAMHQIISNISAMARTHAELPMLSRTHGQTATPTTLGKEMAVFARRLWRQYERLKLQSIEGKMSGAVGNFNAHMSAYGSIDWPSVSRDFVDQRLKLSWNPLTTQIETHDTFVEYMDIVRSFNTILLDFCRDMWGYISHGYFAQRAVAGEVGSSTMPHKINPIYFENAEGNLGVANSLMQHFAEKLPVSRFQRDLSDSTVLRVTGTALGHTLLAWRSTLKGLSRVAANNQRIASDLEDAWEVLAEPVQTVMRRYGVRDAYELLKAATRGQPTVTRAMIHEMIDACDAIPAAEKTRMKAWTPLSYIGAAPSLVRDYLPQF